MVFKAPPREASVFIHFDVSDIEVACAFYERTLGFKVVQAVSTGKIFPQRRLLSQRFPSVSLVIREGFGKRVGGTQPGAVSRIGLASTDLAADIAGLGASVTWIGKTPDPEAVPASVRFVDPDGYEIELFSAG